MGEGLEWNAYNLFGAYIFIEVLKKVFTFLRDRYWPKAKEGDVDAEGNPVQVIDRWKHISIGEAGWELLVLCDTTG